MARYMCQSLRGQAKYIRRLSSSSSFLFSNVHPLRSNTLMVYRPLSQLAPGSTSSHASFWEWPDSSKRDLRKHLRAFSANKEAKNVLSQHGISEQMWPKLTKSFHKAFLDSPPKFFDSESEKRTFLDDCQIRNESFHTLLEKCMLYAEDQGYIVRMDSEALKFLQVTDLRLPHEWFPRARQISRHIIYHGGPTNSGKTFQALERLQAVSSSFQGEHDELSPNDDGFTGGIFCGPLRLLAHEIYEKLNQQGVYCSLLTGQDKREIPGAEHIACTIEMVNPKDQWEVAVIDEIQMISDPERGFAWTRALACLQAKEIHVCGSLEAVDLVKARVAQMGDTFELRTYERRGKLSVMDTPLNNYRKVEKGDAVVAFSRKRIFEIRAEIEQHSNLKCCVVYGSLPPEIRSQQASLFNDPNSGYDVLVASDAIGMGLNLNIRRVILDSLQKFDGQDMVKIPPSLVKQIAGRAGRSGHDYADEGLVTCLRSGDLEYLNQAFNHELEPLVAAGLFPSNEQMEDFAAKCPDISGFSELLDKFVLLARVDGSYFICNHLDIKKKAELLKDLPLSLGDRFTFSMAPVGRTFLSHRLFQAYAKAHSCQEQVKLSIFLPDQAPRTDMQLRQIEIKSHIIDLYLWLAMRFEDTFIQKDLALELKEHVIQLVTEGLVNTTASKTKRRSSSETSSGRLKRGPHGDNASTNPATTSGKNRPPRSSNNRRTPRKTISAESAQATTSAQVAEAAVKKVVSKHKRRPLVNVKPAVSTNASSTHTSSSFFHRLKHAFGFGSDK